ncbi:MAG: hypothetical protein KI790_16625 [Cyclobacteriaceae bacterium]|nr:hypothetical protein [Cyclobacteriaceae bacterium HetDA_MAG_MS6]
MQLFSIEDTDGLILTFQISDPDRLSVLKQVFQGLAYQRYKKEINVDEAQMETMINQTLYPRSASVSRSVFQLTLSNPDEAFQIQYLGKASANKLRRLGVDYLSKTLQKANHRN